VFSFFILSNAIDISCSEKLRLKLLLADLLREEKHRWLAEKSTAEKKTEHP